MSTIKTETLSTPSNATVPVDTVVNGTAKAWVNFNGSGTVAIRRAFNVSSITDLGTGYYQYNFTTAMPDANYCVVAHFAQNGNSNPNFSIVGQELYYTTSSFRTNMNNATGGSSDRNYIFAAVFS